MSYVANDPVNFIDPEGKAAIIPGLIIGGAIVAAGSFTYQYVTDPFFQLSVDVYINNKFNEFFGPPRTPKEPRPSPPEFFPKKQRVRYADNQCQGATSAQNN